mmetsp:Transcript_54359/g.151417  ORF Transcript_54359/g.151417 Transcript_54359/m.151417 type:complete len:83 (-) Transcript_54359:20-268(-)
MPGSWTTEGLFWSPCCDAMRAAPPSFVSLARSSWHVRSAKDSRRLARAIDEPSAEAEREAALGAANGGGTMILDAHDMQISP